MKCDSNFLVYGSNYAVLRFFGAVCFVMQRGSKVLFCGSSHVVSVVWVEKQGCCNVNCFTFNQLAMTEKVLLTSSKKYP